MNVILKNEIIKAYGKQCEKHMTEIEKRLLAMITALCFAGNQGNNPLCIINQAFENLNKY